MANKSKIWTITSMVAAAMGNKPTQHSVQIKRGKDKHFMLCDVGVGGDCIYARFYYPLKTKDSMPTEVAINPKMATEILAQQKALTPTLKQQRKIEVRAAKGAKKALKKQAKVDKVSKKDTKPPKAKATKKVKDVKKAKPKTVVAPPAPVQ